MLNFTAQLSCLPTFLCSLRKENLVPHRKKTCFGKKFFCRLKKRRNRKLGPVAVYLLRLKNHKWAEAGSALEWSKVRKAWDLKREPLIKSDGYCTTTILSKIPMLCSIDVYVCFAYFSLLPGCRFILIIQLALSTLAWWRIHTLCYWCCVLLSTIGCSWVSSRNHPIARPLAIQPIPVVGAKSIK